MGTEFSPGELFSRVTSPFDVLVRQIDSLISVIIIISKKAVSQEHDIQVELIISLYSRV